MVIFLSMTTIITYWYYGSKCLGYLVGAEYQYIYIWIYIILIVVAAVVSLEIVIGFVDGMFAMMAIPTMVSTLLLAKKVNIETKRYFQSHFKEPHAGWNQKNKE
jgi:AGCS family alanine or glycine:cation symporter